MNGILLKLKRGLSNFFIGATSNNPINQYIENDEGIGRIILNKEAEKDVFISVLQLFYPPCSNCDSNTLQLWIEGKYSFRVKCSGCKNEMSKTYYGSDRNNNATVVKDPTIDGFDLVDVEEIILDYIDYAKFIESYIDKEAEYRWYLWTKKGSYFYDKLDFNLLKSKNPLLGAITFESCYELEEKDEVMTLNKRSRRISQSVMDKVWNRDGGKCVECSSNENLEFDHIIPFSKGGANTYRNIQLLCENCNRIKSDKIG